VQTVDIAAANKVGTTWSTTKSITPYGTPTAPTNPVINSNSSTATATITPSWSGPADSGGGGVTYQWNFTQGSSASGSTTGTTGTAQNVGAGDYSFQVRACNAGGLCSGYATSASRHIDNPPPPPAPVISFSKGGVKTGTQYYYHIEATNFTANTNFSAKCYSNDGTGDVLIGTTALRSDNSTKLAFDGAGSFSGDIACWDGFSNTNHVVINSVTSNSVKF